MTTGDHCTIHCIIELYSTKDTVQKLLYIRESRHLKGPLVMGICGHWNSRIGDCQIINLTIMKLWTVKWNSRSYKTRFSRQSIMIIYILNNKKCKPCETKSPSNWFYVTIFTLPFILFTENWVVTLLTFRPPNTYIYVFGHTLVFAAFKPLPVGFRS